MDEFDDIFEQLFGDDEESEDPATPNWRATIRRGRLTLRRWAPWLAHDGPVGNLFRYRARADVAIADLTVTGDDNSELIVNFHSAGRDPEQAEEVLVEWAETIGCRRAWLGDRVVSLKGPGVMIGTARVRCPTCLARWVERSPGFWLSVRRAGAFPQWCPLCGNELPQWTVSSPSAATAHKLDDATGRWASERAPRSGHDGSTHKKGS